jgi:hypothetical protein
MIGTRWFRPSLLLHAFLHLLVNLVFALPKIENQQEVIVLPAADQLTFAGFIGKVASMMLLAVSSSTILLHMSTLFTAKLTSKAGILLFCTALPWIWRNHAHFRD